jgi:hypothetical protein
MPEHWVSSRKWIDYWRYRFPLFGKQQQLFLHYYCYSYHDCHYESYRHLLLPVAPFAGSFFENVGLSSGMRVVYVHVVVVAVRMLLYVCTPIE